MFLAADGTRTFLGWVAFFIEKNGSQFLSGTLTTLYISLTGTIVGFFIGLCVSLVREAYIDEKTSGAKKFFIKFFQVLIKI